MTEPTSKFDNSFESVDPLANYRNTCSQLLESAVMEFKVKKVPQMEIPTSPELADFAYPCFSLAKDLKLPPQKIAEMLLNKIGAVENLKISAVKGYLNFKINLKPLAGATIPLILKEKQEYGTFPNIGKRIILEHTSANPNGPFHVGRARNPIIGDTLARLLRKVGYEVEVQYWVNDMGKQAAILGWGVQNLSGDSLPAAGSTKKDHELVRYYQSAYKKMEEDPDVEGVITRMIQSYERGDIDELNKLKKPCSDVLAGMVESLERMNIFVDKFVWESESVLDGGVDEVIAKLKKSKITKEEEGAYYLDLEGYELGGKTSRFVFTRSDGTSLYTTRDLAYHWNKLQNCDIAINILGEDHKLQARQLEIALKIMGMEHVPEVVFYSFVSLEEGKMSTRKGQVVYLDDLMEEAAARARKEVETRRPELPDDKKSEIADVVGLGAIRYNLIRVQPEKKIVFKWMDALNFEGNSAPFVQYSHARACSILRKAEEMLAGYSDYSTDLLDSPAEDELIRNLARLPSLIHECAHTRKPHPVAAYAYKTAALFNQFYKDCPVLPAESDELRASRLALVEASRWALAVALDLIGINAPEQM
ncbi:MAG: arginine--tRNA ligase [Thermoplasmata archaeon]|nr:MAG: arginine--tRNA ligase [Thermoplasmata archaeon]